MRIYPSISDSKPETIKTALDFIVRERKSDISEWDNLPNIFMRGRKVGKVPSGSTDVAVTDRLGDFNYSASYLYICIDNSSTTAWRRASLGAW